MRYESDTDHAKRMAIKPKRKVNVNSRSPIDVVSFQIHNVSIVDENDIQTVDNLFKTYNSAKRCAYKRFESIGLYNLMKNKKPSVRKGSNNFTNWMYKEAPAGMSDEMWEKMRRQSFNDKKNYGLSHANRFWQLDKDLGKPISGTISIVGEWIERNSYSLDSTLLHDAVMSAYGTYMSFSKKKAKYQTSKTSPAFGEIERRSRKEIDKCEFQLTKNGSITVVGKAKVGNQKFKFDVEHEMMSLTFNRKKIWFSYSSNRRSRKGHETLTTLLDMMNSGRLPVTVTLKKVNDRKFSIVLSYSPIELKSLKKEYVTHKKNIASGIYVTDEVICHQVIDTSTNKVLHSKTYDIGEVSGFKMNRHAFETLKWEKKYDELEKLTKRIHNRTHTETSKLLNKIFNINLAYGVSDVVVESSRSKTRKNFNKSLLEFNVAKIGDRSIDNMFMSSHKFNQMVKNHCTKNGMTFNKVNGEFVQLKAAIESKTMKEAIRKACSSIVEKHTGRFELDLTYLLKQMPNPSMLDWVKHLLHNKRNRQARMEIRKIIQDMAVKKAVSLCDDRSSCGTIEKGRHSPMGMDFSM